MHIWKTDLLVSSSLFSMTRKRFKFLLPFLLNVFAARYPDTHTFHTLRTLATLNRLGRIYTAASAGNTTRAKLILSDVFSFLFFFFFYYIQHTPWPVLHFGGGALLLVRLSLGAERNGGAAMELVRHFFFLSTSLSFSAFLSIPRIFSFLFLVISPSLCHCLYTQTFIITLQFTYSASEEEDCSRSCGPDYKCHAMPWQWVWPSVVWMCDGGHWIWRVDDWNRCQILYHSNEAQWPPWKMSIIKNLYCIFGERARARCG